MCRHTDTKILDIFGQKTHIWLLVYTLVYPINRYKLIAVHNVKHPQKINSQEANNCPFFDI